MDTCASTNKRGAPVPAEPGTAEPGPTERHYTAGEVAELWHLALETVRRLFSNEPGVVVLRAPRSQRWPRRSQRVAFSERRGKFWHTTGTSGRFPGFQ